MGDMKVRVFGDTAVVTGTDDEITMKTARNPATIMSGLTFL